tara:strand:+ start:91 stop:216 length:126 start_codon:yes stop_codon:yes gene_type:complete
MSLKEKKKSGDLFKDELAMLFAEPHRNDEAIIQLIRKHFDL